ncbi:MAG: PHP domain-containing protein [Deltaproteobacteria bacterium]|nr:PHP domain-containing protein [Deltaproteobacteria bacterium]
MKVITADLHVHTCLSPCATLDMTPRKIIRRARENGLAMIAVTDHNSAENASAMTAAARSSGLCIIPGMEIATSEEVHLLGLFPAVEHAVSMQTLVYQNLQPGQNDEDLFGIQVITNEFEEVEGFNTRLLIGATELRIDEAVSAIHARDGLAIAAHVDRQSFSVLSQLGFISEDMTFDALEISKRLTLKEARITYRQYERFPFITSSDAHDLNEIGVSPTHLRLSSPGFTGLRMALAGEGGSCVIEDNASLAHGGPVTPHIGPG